MGQKRIGLENTDNVKDVLRKEIVSFLKENELSRYGIAKALKIPESYLNQVLASNGKPVSFSKLCEIATGIGMKLTLVIEKK